VTSGGPDTTERAPRDPFYAALLEDDAEELYDNAPCGYLSLLPDGTIIKANHTFLAWSGYDRDGVVGRRRLSELLAPGDRIYYETHLAPMLRMQGRVREIAVELVLHDGGRLPVLANAVTKADAAGSPMIVRVALFDATERRAYERELLAARRRAEDSERRAVALARTLQSSLLPPTILQPPGLEVGAAYRPSGDGSTVGGDFYDIFEAADGSVAILLGDVAGKGAEAAVLTSLVRHTVRTEALRRPDPTHVLHTVSDAFLRYQPGAYCTLVLVVVGPAPRTSATVATGGHHLPVRHRAGGTMGRIGAPGQILGLLADPEIGEATVELEPGDTVVLFTDGVVEARRGDEFFDEDRLLTLVSGAAHAPAQQLADAVVAAALDFQDGDARDDIAVVAWKVVDDSTR
jgi:sigma-B regulation protein RsbU (phosphoserine phosphatase)